MNENQIPYKAIEQLEKTTGLTATWKPLQDEIDGKLRLKVNKETMTFFVEIKKELRMHQLDKIVTLAERYTPLLVIAENIFPTIKKILRDKQIAYLDTAGNIFVRTADQHIWIDGHKVKTEKIKTATNRAFTKTGLKTLFFLLVEPEAINMPYRQLAEMTDTALGNIRNVIEGLKEANYILQVNTKTMKLQHKKALLDRWVEGYREKLRPQLYIGAYKFWNKEKFNDWQKLKVNNEHTVWGASLQVIL